MRSPFAGVVPTMERLALLSVAGYQRMVARAGEAAGFPFLVHSHMLRDSCGYKPVSIRQHLQQKTDGAGREQQQQRGGNRAIPGPGSRLFCAPGASPVAFRRSVLWLTNSHGIWAPAG
jgi:hypothetical protein